LINRRDRSTKEVFEEIMKGRSFCLMGEDRIAILVVKVFNLVFPKAAGGAQMEISGVFISKGAIFYFCALSPVSGFVGDFLAQVGFCKGSEATFQGREVPVLFETIEERDDRTTIKKIDGRELTLLCPSSSSRADSLKPEAKSANRREVGMSGANTIPIGMHNGGEGVLCKPGVLQTENGAAGGFRRSSKVEGDVVRGGAS
jgi:hypothetical protein